MAKYEKAGKRRLFCRRKKEDKTWGIIAVIFVIILIIASQCS